MNKLEVGQKLWWVWSDACYFGTDKAGTSVEVQAVGRKWAKLKNGYRIELETLVADGGQYNSPGRCYASEEAYEQHQALLRAWDTFRRRAEGHRQVPAHLTIEVIREATALLFGEPAHEEVKDD